MRVPGHPVGAAVLPTGMGRHYGTFHEAYADQLREVYTSPTFSNAPRGYRSRERLAAGFAVSDARQRVPFIPARRANVVFNFAEALWYVAARDDLAFIEHYAPSIRQYSMDGQRLTGTAYGPKLFGDRSGRSQVDTVLDVLRSDPDSKRAVAQIFAGSELTVPDNRDVSCTLGLQFLLREGVLHAVAYMRANDAFRGMTSDVFSFTLIQELIAAELGVEPGSYVHVAGSLHVYQVDDDRAAAVLADPATGRPAPYAFPPMPRGDNRPAIRELLRLEERLRAGSPLGVPVDRIDLPPYWSWVALLFEIHRRVRRSEPVTADLLAELPPAYQFLVVNRWPAAIEGNG